MKDNTQFEGMGKDKLGESLDSNRNINSPKSQTLKQKITGEEK